MSQINNNNKISQTEKAKKYFTPVSIDGENQLFKCTILNCKKIINGKKQANLVSHIRACHQQIYKNEIAPTKDEKYYKEKRLKFVQNCAELIGINGRPFGSLLDSGFQKFVESDLKELSEGGDGLNINDNGFKEIRAYIEQIAVKIKNQIKCEVKGQFICLMVDIARKNNKSFLGINIQYTVDGIVKCRSLGMKQLKQAHTSKFIKEVISNCFLLFDITVDQLVSITTDNGSNMMAMIDLYNDDDVNSEENNSEESQQGGNNNVINSNGTTTEENVCISL